MADAALAAMLQRAAEEPSERFVAEMLLGRDGGGVASLVDGVSTPTSRLHPRVPRGGALAGTRWRAPRRQW